MNFLIIFLGKLISKISLLLNLGNGSTWPGHIALKLNKDFVKDNLKNNSKTKIILIVGTNGKTTTSKLIRTILKNEGKTFLHNKSGANLLNGIASSIVISSNLLGHFDKDFAIFEIDENALPKVLKQTDPDYVICLNLFRDQLDRYGEIDSIAKKWQVAFAKLSTKTTLILNADDPQIAFLAKNIKIKSLYFGLPVDNNNTKTEHGADSTFCPKCSTKLNYTSVFFSHLGDWFCPKCKLKRPKLNLSVLKTYPADGTYSKYNALASALFAKNEGSKDEEIENDFKTFIPAFGRQEKLNYKNKNVQIFLSKNPISFNQSLQTIKELGGKNILIVLNDKIPDGLDVSWIWDINFEEILEKDMNIGISGDRVYDMSLRLKYASFFCHVEPNLETIINKMIENLDKKETLYILPNYSAMLDTRKILTGKKIL